MVTRVSRAIGQAMSQGTGVLEGCFAVNKARDLTSADVIRVLQAAFKPSKFFAPWFKREEHNALANTGSKQHRRNRRLRNLQVKLGHGGTLDPLATGVLIIGAGGGTKQLSNFLGCTKSYETVVLFGAATDTYDVRGKIVGRASYEHITRSTVEEALSKFRGDIMQRPPVFSALHINGKRAYEYAREGAELPKELAPRPVTISELEIVEWLEGGQHEYHFPEQEAAADSKNVAQKYMQVPVTDAVSPIVRDEEGTAAEDTTSDKKRKSEVLAEDQGADSTVPDKRVKASPSEGVSVAEKKSLHAEGDEAALTMAGALQPLDSKAEETVSQLKERLSRKLDGGAKVSVPSTPCPAPAVRLRMTVSSGTYVRSLAHDLGSEVGSLGIMAALIRSRQERFELGKNVLELDDFEKGEEVWGPSLEAALKEWEQDNKKEVATT